MSGTRLHNFREGDRSEYLASFLLSGLGLVNPVPRQEDIGLDFYCQLAEQEHGVLSFGSPFVVQVKSDNRAPITYGDTAPGKWSAKQIEWLFKQSQPLFIVTVNKQAMSMEFYDCSTLYHHFFGYTPTQIEFIFSNSSIVSLRNPTPIPQWSDNNSDGHKHTIALGLPIITIDNNDLGNKSILNTKKGILRAAINISQQNVANIHNRTAWVNYLTNIKTNIGFDTGWSSLTVPDENIINHAVNSIGLGLLNLAMNLKEHGKLQQLASIQWMIDALEPSRKPGDFDRIFNAITPILPKTPSSPS